MSLIQYEPVSMLNRIHNQLNHLYDDVLPSLLDDGSIVTSRRSPSVDIKEEDNRFVFLTDIPGVDPKDIDVTCENGMLTIKEERRLQTD